MIIQNIALSNFRNFPKKLVKPAQRTTLIIGKNAAGKTNLLEAVYLLAAGRSFRGGKDEEMISYGREMGRVKGKIGEESLEIILTRGEVAGIRAAKKRYLINGVGKRAMDFVGNFRAVLFRPEDLEIVINSPSTRREYLDSVLEQVDREYRRASLSYKKGLRQRNKLLEQIREKQTTRSALFFWDQLLLENGQLITAKRKEFLDFINQQPDFFGDLEIKYDHSLISKPRLAKYAESEVAAGMTLIGPHRDDFRISTREKNDYRRNLSVYGSRGEQRLAVFSLKIAELEFMTEKTGQRPVLLLDDIFSELDENNREHLVEVIPRQQTLITATEEKLVEKGFRQKMEKIVL